MIDGIKADDGDDGDSFNVPSYEDPNYEEQKSDAKSPLQFTKAQSMVEPPKTDKLYGKRLYSPLANVKRINPR